MSQSFKLLLLHNNELIKDENNLFLLASSIEEEQNNHRQISYVQVPLLWVKRSKMLKGKNLWFLCGKIVQWKFRGETSFCHTNFIYLLTQLVFKPY